MPVVFEPPVRWWHCPACGLRDRTQQAGVHTQMHTCPAIRGLVAPLVQVAGPEVGADARQVVVLSEDYVGQNDPTSAVRTERGDGSNDCTVYPQTANLSMGAN